MSKAIFITTKNINILTFKPESGCVQPYNKIKKEGGLYK